MSKNSPRQTVQALKEWLTFMKVKPKTKTYDNTNNAHNSIGEFMKRNK